MSRSPQVRSQLHWLHDATTAVEVYILRGDILSGDIGECPLRTKAQVTDTVTGSPDISDSGKPVFEVNGNPSADGSEVKTVMGTQSLTVTVTAMVTSLPTVTGTHQTLKMACQQSSSVKYVSEVVADMSSLGNGNGSANGNNPVAALGSVLGLGENN